MSVHNDALSLFRPHFVIGAAVVLGPMLGTVLGLAALVARRTVAAPWLVRLGAGAVGLALATSVALAFRMRWAILHAVGADLGAALATGLLAQRVVAVLGIVATSVLAVAWSVAHPGRVRVRGFAAGALLALVLVYAFRDTGSDVGRHCFDLRCHYAAMVDEEGPSPAPVRALIVCVGLTAAALIWLRRATPTSRGHVMMNLGLLAVGIAGYVATRPFARDAASLVPLWDAPQARVWEGLPALDSPAAPATCSTFGPHLEMAIDDAAAYVDGAQVSDLGAALSARYMGREWIGDRPLGILAADHASFAAIRARIGVAQRVGFRQFFAMTRASRPPFVSSSLGVLARSPRTCLVWLSDAQLASVSPPPATWGDFVARAAAAPR